MKRKLLRPSFLILIFTSWMAEIRAQEEKDELSGQITTRSMYTANNGGLEDFSITVSWAKLKYEKTVLNGLTFGASGIVLANYGKRGIEKQDATTGSGPIYEGNLWNQKTMDGYQEFNVPEFYLNYETGEHLIRLGIFTEDTPLINTEAWPFPAAMEGVWYKYQPTEGIGFKAEAGYIERISSRFVGHMRNPGASVGSGGTGVGLDGFPSQYSGATTSSFQAIAKLGYTTTNNFEVNIWNYLAQNISNTLYAEASWKFGEQQDWNASVFSLHQNRIGDGGNINEGLRYFTDESARALSAFVEHKIAKNTFSIAYTKIGDKGRLLMPREWGKEPFYTFQRRTRIEGMRDASAMTLKWERNVYKDNYDLTAFSSLGQHWLATPSDAAKNKYQVPSTLHWDGSIKYSPKKKFSGLEAELYIAYRFLTDKEVDNPRYIINRANFFHTDFILSYVF